MKHAWLILPVAAITVGSFFLARVTASAAEKDASRDLGNIKPGSRIEQQFIVRNNENTPVVLSGFEEACGLSATIAGNGIILPGQAETLTLQTQAERVRGPGGVRFSLGLSRDGKKTTETYTMVWNVLGDPWFSEAEVWLDQKAGSAKTLTAHGLYEAQHIQLDKAPEGVEVEVKNNAVVIRCTSPAGENGQEIHLNVHGGDSELKYRIPVYWRPLPAVRLYPEMICLSPSTKPAQVLSIVGSVPPNGSVKTSDPAVTAKLNGASITLSASKAASKEVTLSLLDGQGKTLTNATVFVVQ